MGKKSSKKKNKAVKHDDEYRFDASKPQFRKAKERDQKVVLDERFASVLTDERFQLNVRDKYGRRNRKKKDAKDELSAFYTVEKDDGAPQASSDVKERKKDTRGSDNEDESDGDQQQEAENPASRIAYLTALSRGQLDLSSSSSESSSDEEGEDDGSEVVADSDEEEGDESTHAGVLDPSSKEETVDITHEPTKFLAVLNLDWSHVRAVDVFALLSSFSPPGAVKRVRVYVSDFGKEKLAEEERLGPSGIWKDTGSHNKDVEQSSEGSLEADDGSRSSSNDESSAVDDAESDEQSFDEDEFLPKDDHVDSGFDREKLRAYEAAKLKYYFAVAEFASPEHADAAYKEVDGLEFEHSSAAVDLRAIPASELDDVISDRELRDEASSIPSNYVPPDFIVGALQQTNLSCTWEAGDRDRERTLTKYASGSAWQALAESDDLKAYLASDASSDEEGGSDNERASNMRRLLGLDDDDDEPGDGDRDNVRRAEPDSSRSSSSSESDGEDEGETMSKEVVFIPGQKKESLENKIRSKLSSSNEVTEELTPWQKYQQKRKEKKRERRAAAQSKRQSGKKSGQRIGSGADDSDDSDVESVDRESAAQRPTREELELLMAGDENNEETRDYDMRELQRAEKLKDKKLRGSRKRKEEDRAANVSGADFKVDLDDDRFKAVLEGNDDRFGIDRTDPRYKETPAMKDILTEQARRRKAKKQKKSKEVVVAVAPDVNADALGTGTSAGAAALSALVSRIKSKVQ